MAKPRTRVATQGDGETRKRQYYNGYKRAAQKRGMCGYVIIARGEFTMQHALNHRVVRWLGVAAVVLLAACAAIFFLELYKPPRELSALLPTRTPTRRPPPTITPVAYPPTPLLVQSDTFATQDNLPRATGAKHPFGYDDDGYVLTPPLDPGFVRVLHQTFKDTEYLNLSLVADAAPAPDSAAIEYGVLFWHGQDDAGRENFLAFTVDSQSKFRLLAFEPITSTTANVNAFRFTEIVSATTSSAIHVDGASNELRVDAHPRRLLAYINGDLVIDTSAKIISDWRLRRDFDGRVGIIALTLGEPGAQARFTRLDIYADIKKP